MNNFICLKWGEKYSASYVNRLNYMIKNNMSEPFTLHCITENSSGIDVDVNILPIQNDVLEGWWYKLMLFQSSFYDIQGEVVFLDLDVVITSDITDLFYYKPGKFVIAYDKATKGYNSSVFRIKIGDFAHVWDGFIANKSTIVNTYYGDQDWITKSISNVSLWPEKWVLSFKKDCDSRAKRSYGTFGRWLRKKGIYSVSGEVSRPKSAKVVLFHGKPEPEDVAYGPYDIYYHAPWISECWGK